MQEFIPEYLGLLYTHVAQFRRVDSPLQTGKKNGRKLKRAQGEERHGSVKLRRSEARSVNLTLKMVSEII